MKKQNQTTSNVIFYVLCLFGHGPALEPSMHIKWYCQHFQALVFCFSFVCICSRCVYVFVYVCRCCAYFDIIRFWTIRCVYGFKRKVAQLCWVDFRRFFLFVCLFCYYFFSNETPPSFAGFFNTCFVMFSNEKSSSFAGSTCDDFNTLFVLCFWTKSHPTLLGRCTTFFIHSLLCFFSNEKSSNFAGLICGVDTFFKYC